jgi:Abortive infection alpha
MSDAGEIIKSGAFNKLADIAHKLAGPLAEELGLMMADKVKLYRLKNWVNVVRKAEKILNEAHLPPNAVPPRMFLPILEASSVEDDETLQGLWAGLLASASEQSDSLSPSFVETLKQLTPSEAKNLHSLFAKRDSVYALGAPNDMHLKLAGNLDHAKFNLMTETFERLGLIRRQYDLQKPLAGLLGGLPRERFLPERWRSRFGEFDEEEPLPELTYKFEFTEYGIQFMNACLGPQKVKPSQSE